MPTDTGTWFVVGTAEKGPTDSAVAINSLTDFVRNYGSRQSYSVLYDAVDTFFREGGARVYVSRLAGPAAAKASHALVDSVPATTITVEAASEGDWGNDLKVGVAVSGGNFTITIYESDGTTVLEQAGPFADKDEALAWSDNLTYVRFVSGGGTGDPVAVGTPAALTGGDDDLASIDEDGWNDALSNFPSGPGQVSMPGRTTAEAHENLLAYAAAQNKFALMDAVDDSDAATVAASGTAISSDGNAEYGALFAPHVLVPGVVAGTTRRVPYSAVQAGLESRRNKFGSTAVPAAGNKFPLQYVVSLAAEFESADRETLLLAGVNTAANRFGVLQTYGYRTAADADTVPLWWQINHSRVRMAISAEAERVGDGYVFSVIDGQGQTAASLQAELTGMLMDFFLEGALFGVEPSDAFRVDCTPEIADIEAGILRATASVRLSSQAELVIFELVRVPLAQSL